MDDLGTLARRVDILAANQAVIVEALRSHAEALQALGRKQVDFETGIKTLITTLDTLTQRIFSDEIPGERPLAMVN